MSEARSALQIRAMTARASMDPVQQPRLRELADELGAAFRAWRGESWSEATFDALALRAFSVQFEGNRPFRLYCEARGVGPDTVGSWRDVPPVPTAAFRSVDLVVGDASAAPLLFRTSGTTRGPSSRGRHAVLFPSLYRDALRPPFRRFVLGSQERPRILTLVPPPSEVPDSSLGWMLEDVRHAFGGPDSACLADRDGVRWEELDAKLRDAADAGRPVCLLGTTVAFAAWNDRTPHGTGHVRLPPGSVLMDTGGAKGRPGLDRAEMLARLAARIGLDPGGIVNEFGMTELLSQRYGRGLAEPSLVGPPWLRTVALDPVTLDARPDGEEGILCHWDLANVGSVVAVLTEDRGRVEDGAVRWLGRSPGAPPRGCSLATAELLEAQSRGRG